jgi:hypothetical protein
MLLAVIYPAASTAAAAVPNRIQQQFSVFIIPN